MSLIAGTGAEHDSLINMPVASRNRCLANTLRISSPPHPTLYPAPVAA